MPTTLTATRDQIILAAFRKLGIVEPADSIGSIDAALVTNASFNLNLIIKQMMTKGIKLWTIQEYILPYIQGLDVYAIYEGALAPDLDEPRPLKLIQAWIRNSSSVPYIDTPVQILSQQEYTTLGSKYSEGTTNSIYLEQRVDSAALYVFLVPNEATTDDYELHFNGQRSVFSLEDGDDILDFPNEWYNALVWSLADDLAIEFELPSNHRQELSARAAAYRDQLEEWDVEYTSTYFQVDTRSMRRSFR